ncbi:DUF3304 domain-containing protein (plasmid) [Paraburkholderia sprentiae WSM5005]|uniref:DUF3304 domain-containing protein n=1 Tax=Paraburkholderia sprentiae WSM5005 TaxID=754502 RepID=A0A8F4KI74_9BURK|nr:DUF3304 domain-containing protein [Paraburkholderia sprentiae]QXE07349.1 DUF3304 domain-containing protein [Paraburkholderia sprentiae WSM5005]
MLKTMKRWGSLLLLAGVTVFTVGKACSQETYGPYHVTGYNYTDRNIAAFDVDDFGGGDSQAHEKGGGGGIVCCLDIPKRAKTLHIKVVLGLTWDQYNKNLPNDTYETDIAVPELPNKRDGYIEFHFLPERKIEAKWVDFPTTPHIPNAKN